MQYDEFVEKVAERAGTSAPRPSAPPSRSCRRSATGSAATRPTTCFATLREAITLGEFRDVLEQLDPDYADLLA